MPIEPRPEWLAVNPLCALPAGAGPEELERVAICNAAAAAQCNADKEAVAEFFKRLRRRSWGLW